MFGSFIRRSVVIMNWLKVYSWNGERERIEQIVMLHCTFTVYHTLATICIISAPLASVRGVDVLTHVLFGICCSVWSGCAVHTLHIRVYLSIRLKRCSSLTSAVARIAHWVNLMAIGVDRIVSLIFAIISATALSQWVGCIFS